MMNHASPRIARALSLLGAVLAMAAPASAQEVVSISPDITIEVGGGGTVVSDHAVAVDNLLGIVALESLGAIPDVAAVIGYGLDVNSNRLFVLDTTSSLPGGAVARAGDVVRYDGVNHSVAFDARANGIPSGSRIDAVSLSANGLLLSVDTTVELPGGLVVSDEDLFEWNGSSYVMRLDGSGAGVPVELDVDAAQDLGSERYLLSFDTSGTVGGVYFADEDILRFQDGLWSLELATTSLGDGWGPADVEAMLVPEPNLAVALLVGSGLLAAVGRGRRHGLQRGARRAARAGSTRSAVATCLTFSALTFGAVTVVAGAGQAADGVHEINMTCAEVLGCFPGDTPGFPVTITEPGAYQLTGTLVLPSANTTGISIATDHVEIDLAGFGIEGPGTTGTGVGISGPFGRSGIYVHDGFVAGVGRDGISLGPEAFVARMVVHGCARDGIVVGSASRLEENVVRQTTDDGLVAGPYSTLLANIVNGVGDNGIVAEGGTMLRENIVTSSGNTGLVVLPNAGSVVSLANNYLTGSSVENFDPAATGAIAIAIAPNFCLVSSWCFQNQ